MSRKNIYQIISEQKVDPTNAFERQNTIYSQKNTVAQIIVCIPCLHS